MTFIKITSYEIKVSKTNYKIPVVNGVHLHSMYNPIKEAYTLVTNNEKLLKSKNQILILGMGFGYHIKFAMTQLSKLHDKNYHIMVIEPNKQVVDDCEDEVLKNNKNLTIHGGLSIDDLYKNDDLINFLADKPGIIAHPASLSLYGVYFKKFLGYSAANSILDICNNSKYSEITEYFKDFKNVKNLDSYIEKSIIQKKTITHDIDYFFLAFKDITAKKAEHSLGDQG
ncbi:MAG: hypothetical protein ISR65_04155 [Bacteriovoracaceae bacterium]|nr:hypothetical protein [Bacteriovoracaceae bacterium]